MFILPLFIMSLREWVRSYIIFAQANMPDEQIPWATIIIIPPATPIVKADKRLTIIIAMCTTEEYAIITFISLNVKHATLRIIPPNRPTTIMRAIILYTAIKAMTRIIPYPPSFNNTPAKIIEPETGASTCAFGNHWWNKNIGNLTKNAMIIIIKNPLLKFKNEKFIIKMFKLTPDLVIIMIINNKGKEANNVYMRRKNLAFNRSIW